MEIRYPNGQVYTPDSETEKKKNRKKPVALDRFAKRGMGLEDDINRSNEYYNSAGRCLVYKRPTPIRVVRMQNEKIVEAYFSEKSTTDYNGIYRGKYLDFEAKETMSRTSFAFKNIRPQQITHLKRVIELGGIAFFIIRFKSLNETYLLDCRDFLPYLESTERKSMPYEECRKKGVLIEEGLSPRLRYLDAVDRKYFGK